MKKIVRRAWTIWLMCFFLFFLFSVGSIIKNISSLNANSIPSLELLPDNKFYKLIVLRNKIVEKMIIGSVKRVEFDLLMADKTIYASKLLLDRGEVVLAKDTALKGENYYSMLVQAYNKALLQKGKIPASLDNKITLAAIEHQEIFGEMENKVEGEDKKTFQIVSKFSKINYEFIVGLRNPKK